MKWEFRLLPPLVDLCEVGEDPVGFAAVICRTIVDIEVGVKVVLSTLPIILEGIANICRSTTITLTLETKTQVPTEHWLLIETERKVESPIEIRIGMEVETEQEIGVEIEQEITVGETEQLSAQGIILGTEIQVIQVTLVAEDQEVAPERNRTTIPAPRTALLAEESGQ